MEHLIENVFASHELYYNILTPLCDEYGLSHTEIIILLCLASYPERDTASDVVELRKLTKSAVSVAVRSLQEKGFVVGEHLNGNHRSIHLRLCESALPAVEACRRAQEQYLDVLLDGFSESDRERLGGYFERIADNIRTHGVD